MPGFRSMADMRNDQDAPDDDEKLRSYAGGDKSGLAVEHPKGHGKGKGDAYAGAERASGPAENAVTVYVYTDGFVVDQGPFRPIVEAANATFMSDLRSGVAPEELGQGRTGQVAVTVRDMGAPFDGKPPHLAAAGGGGGGSVSAGPASTGPAAFTGEGQSLGGAAKTAALDKDAATSTVDKSKAVTKLQVRFHDGTRKAAEFNQDATVQEVHNFVAAAVGGASFQIIEGFPPKPLTDMSATLKDAGLLNAAVTVKLT